MHSKIDLYKQHPSYPGDSLTLHLDNIKKLIKLQNQKPHWIMDVEMQNIT